MGRGQAIPSEGPLPDTKLHTKAGIALVTEPLSFEDGQPVQLEDGSMAYIHHAPKGGVSHRDWREGRGTGGQRLGHGVAYPGSWGIGTGAVVPKLSCVSSMCHPWYVPPEQLFLPQEAGPSGSVPRGLMAGWLQHNQKVLGLEIGPEDIIQDQE